MSEVLVAGAAISCGHPPGLLAVTASQTVLRVGGKQVLLAKDVAGAAGVAGCAIAPPGCKKVQSPPPVTGSMVLTVNGDPVALSSSTGITDQGGTVTVIAAGQTALTAT